MNAWGPEGCKQKIDTIVGWLQKEAKDRKLPFSKTVARTLVSRCIKKAEQSLKDNS